MKSRYTKLWYRHAKYISYEQKDRKNTHTKNAYKNTHINTEVSRKAYGTKAGQEYQVPIEIAIFLRQPACMAMCAHKD